MNDKYLGMLLTMVQYLRALNRTVNTGLDGDSLWAIESELEQMGVKPFDWTKVT